MDEQLINKWHCDECEGIFYTDLETQPIFCPHCEGTLLSDSMVYTIKPIK